MNEIDTTSGAHAADPRSVWASAEFARIGAQHVLAHELLAHAVGVHAGERVLDVGAGTGNAAIAAARRGARVTALDVVPELLASAEKRADVDGFTISTRVGDAHDLPFPDAAFDVVMSTFAIMFARDAKRAASELVRVCRPGGRIGVTAWSREGFVGEHMATLGRYQPKAHASDALRWSDEAWIRTLFGDRVVDLRREVATVDMCYRSAQEAILIQRRSLGPVRATFDALDDQGQRALAADLERVIARFNEAKDGTVVVAAEYVQITATTKEP